MTTETDQPMPAHESFCAALLTTLALLNVCAPAAAQAEGEYQNAVDIGVREFAAGNWEEAHVNFEHAYQLRPGPRPLRGMGMSLYEQKRYAEAVDALERALSLQDTDYPLTDEMRSSTEQLLATARKYVATLTLTVEPRDATVRVDGRAAQAGTLYLNSGQHEIEVTHGGKRELRRLEVRLGEELAITMAVRADSAAEPVDGAPAAPAPAAAFDVDADDAGGGMAGPIAAFSVGGAGLLTFGIFGVMALGEHGRLSDECMTSCSDDDVATLGTYNLIADIGLGVGLVGTAVGIWLWQVAGDGSEEAATLRPALGPGYVGLSAQGRL